MHSKEPESSFQSPENYRKYAKEARMALAAYQRIRRPLMFHVLIFLVFFKPQLFITKFSYVNPLHYWVFKFYDFFLLFLCALPILGILSAFRRLEDGFDPDVNEGGAIFKLRISYASSDSDFVEGSRKFIQRLCHVWFWCTWKFYPILLAGPILGILSLIKNGFFLFLDLFFLNCWDRWLESLENGAGKLSKKHLRGSQLEKMPQSAGSAPIEWVKTKAKTVQRATMAFLEECGYDEAKERARIQESKSKESDKTPKKKTQTCDTGLDDKKIDTADSEDKNENTKKNDQENNKD